MKYVMIKYSLNGSIACSENNIPAFVPFSCLITKNVETLRQVEPITVAFPELSEAKIKDVRRLYKYIKQEDVDWIDLMINERNLTV